MNCRQIQGHGFTAICCGRFKSHKCACGRPSGYQCDWKTGKDKTCDKHICEVHALQVDKNKHLCPEHQQAYQIWLEKKKNK